MMLIIGGHRFLHLLPMLMVFDLYGHQIWATIKTRERRDKNEK
ncbi:unnamed protein product [Prunus brigantina]